MPFKSQPEAQTKSADTGPWWGAPIIVAAVLVLYNVLPFANPMKFFVLMAIGTMAVYAYRFHYFALSLGVRGERPVIMPAEAGVCSQAYSKRHVTSDRYGRRGCMLCGTPLR